MSDTHSGDDENKSTAASTPLVEIETESPPVKTETVEEPVVAVKEAEPAPAETKVVEVSRIVTPIEAIADLETQYLALVALFKQYAVKTQSHLNVAIEFMENGFANLKKHVDVIVPTPQD